jgi:MFS family permease
LFGAYLLTQAVTIPIYGRLADFFGRKALLIVAIVVFLIGSILCGFAHSMFALIVFRAIQGIGGGGVQPVSTTIVGDLYQGRDRARVQGYLSTAWAFAAVIGPLFGAFLIAHFGWPIIFWINVPIGLACIAVVVRAYHETIVHVAHRIDYLGSALLALGIGTLMFVLVDLGNGAPIVSGGLAVAGFVVLALLLVHETRAPEPMMPLAMYRIRVIAIANAGNVFVGAMVMGITAFMPTFVQAALGKSAVVAGSALGFFFVGWTCGSIGGARMQLRYGYRTISFIAAVPLIGGSALLAALGADSNIGFIYAGLTLLGLGFGTFNSVFVVSTQGAVTWEMRGAATSSLIFMRQIGQAVGSSTFAAFFNVGIYSRLPDAGNVMAQLVDPARRALIPPLDLMRDANAVAQSLHGVYLIALLLAVAISALAFGVPSQLRSGPAVARPSTPGEPAARGERVSHEA